MPSIALLLISAFFAQRADAAWEVETDRPGMDYKSFWISKDVELFVAAAKCEDACAKESQCKSFTLVEGGVQGVNARCYLKKGVPTPVKNANTTSGVVRPETKADYCRNYASDAVNAYISNINWECGYSGGRWQENEKAHYDWCIGVSQKFAVVEKQERQKALDKCMAPSTSGDLSAYDWCWKIDAEHINITFYPMVKNVTKNKWASKKKGYYQMWLGFGPVIEGSNKYVLHEWPYFWLQPDEIRVLDGFKLPYRDDNDYSVLGWTVVHPEDVNSKNNRHPGFKQDFKGSALSTNEALSRQQCKKEAE